MHARFSIVVGLLALVGLYSACSSDDAATDDTTTSPTKSKCKNGIKDNGETGVDCGGTCGKCPGETCKAGSDCGSGTCTNDHCAPPADGPASDGQKDNGETDVDCGGPNAPKCADGKACQADTDCANAYCKADTKVCATPRADDGIKNGTETDVDCGGKSGKLCAQGLACLVDTDCNGACNYAQKCVDVKSCKPHFGGDTCGSKPMYSGEFGDPDAPPNESCCRTLPVPGYTDPKNPGKQVFVDKYEITAGRVRAFVDALAAASPNGQPNIQDWIAKNPPALWNPDWNMFLPSGTDKADIVVPRQPANPPDPMPWNRNAGTNSAFGSILYIYVHGHNCGNLAGSFGFGTYWYPDALMSDRGEVPRPNGFDDSNKMIPAQEALDAKSMSCIPNAVLAAFCAWDGGQLVTDEVLDFITNAPPSLGSAAGCGTRCAPLAQIQQSSDSGTDTGILYRFPFYDDSQASFTSEGASRIAPPGRVSTDEVRINAGDEPWMDIAGNVHEVALDVNGATFTGNFTLKYRGIGYASARAGGNDGPPPKYSFPEYKAGYAGGRCMRFK